MSTHNLMTPHISRYSLVFSRHALVAAFALLSLTGCGGDSTGPGSDLQPTVSAVSPDSGNVGTQVQISGSNFEVGAAVTFDAIPSDSVVLVNTTILLAFAPTGLVRDAVYDVAVVNPGGKSDVLAAAYKAVGPALLVVNGVSKPSGNTGSTVILEGKAFGDLMSLGSVFFTDASGQPTRATVSLPANWTEEFIVATVPSDADTGPVWVETPTGVSDSINFKILQAATFSPSLINWTATTTMPEALQGPGAMFLSLESGPAPGQLVYVAGGADGSVNPSGSVRYAEVDAAGALSAWTGITDLPVGRAFHGAALATPFNAKIDTLVAGYMYVIGGIDGAGAPTSTIYRSTTDLNRMNQNWVLEAALPSPLHSMGVAVFRSWLYVVGGATIGDAPVAEVYRAHIEEDGSLAAWESQTSLPAPLSYAAVTQAAGVLYVLGGETAATAPGSDVLTTTRTSQIHFNPLDLRTGELTNSSWTLNPSDLIKARAKHTALAAGGWILVSGGLYNGSATSSTEHSFAPINSDATIGTFGGATGSQTIVSGGGDPFFNHAALSYVDAAGTARIVIIGGTDVTNGAAPIADVYFY